jgi:hypothetical protein
MSKPTPETAGTAPGPSLEILIMALLAAGFGALIGWLILSHFVRGLAEICRWEYLAAEANWITPAVVGLLNGLSSWVKNQARWRRRQQRRAVGNQLGLQHTDQADDQWTDAIESLHGGSVLSLSNILHCQFGPAKVIVADMTVDTDRPAGEGQAGEQTRTVVYIDDPAVQFPSMQVAPLQGLARWLTDLVGIRSLDLARHPDFARLYRVSTPTPTATDRFLDDVLLSHLAQDARWQIHAAGQRLLLWQAAGDRTTTDDTSYIDDALAVFQLWRARAVAWQATTEPTAASDSQADLDAAGPLQGWGDCQVVTAHDVETLLQQPVPRRSLPDRLRRQKFGFPIVPLVGLMFSVGGAIFFTASWFEDIQVKNGQEWLLGWMGGGFLLLGLPMLCGALYYRWAWAQLLIHGQVTTAQVQHVQRTEVKVDNRRRFLVTVQYQANGQTITHPLAVYGPAGELAQRSLEDHQPLRVLYVPQQPKRAVIAEGLVS